MYRPNSTPVHEQNKKFSWRLFCISFLAAAGLLIAFSDTQGHYRVRSNRIKRYTVLPWSRALRDISMEIAFCYADLENPPVTTPEKLTAFSKITSLEIKDLVSPAQVYGKNNFGGLAHFYYSSDALKYYLEDQSQTKLPMIIHPYFDLNKSTLIWKVISADGDRIYLSNPQELHDSLQRILLFEQRNSHE